MGSQPTPKQPETPYGLKMPTVQEMARNLLKDRRLLHRYCMIEAGWRPGDSAPTPDDEAYKAAKKRVEMDAKGIAG